MTNIKSINIEHAKNYKNELIGVFDDNKMQIKSIEDEILELKDAILKNEGINDEIGDVLFTIVNLSRHLGYDAESSLKKSTEKFSERFTTIWSYSSLVGSTFVIYLLIAMRIFRWLYQ